MCMLALNWEDLEGEAHGGHGKGRCNQEERRQRYAARLLTAPLPRCSLGYLRSRRLQNHQLCRPPAEPVRLLTPVLCGGAFAWSKREVCDGLMPLGPGEPSFLCLPAARADSANLLAG